MAAIPVEVTCSDRHENAKLFVSLFVALLATPLNASMDSPSPQSRADSPDTTSIEFDETDAFVPSPELLNQYEQLMSSILPPIPATARPKFDGGEDSDEDESTSQKPLTKAEKQNAKKKRRKEREHLARAGDSYPAKAIMGDKVGAFTRSEPSLFRPRLMLSVR